MWAHLMISGLPWVDAQESFRHLANTAGHLGGPRCAHKADICRTLSGHFLDTFRTLRILARHQLDTCPPGSILLSFGNFEVWPHSTPLWHRHLKKKLPIGIEHLNPNVNIFQDSSSFQGKLHFVFGSSRLDPIDVLRSCF